MRSRSLSKESRICELDAVLPIGGPELRKSEASVSSKTRSKCSSVKEHSRSGGTTPRCSSESPTPKCEQQIATPKDGGSSTGTDTPRTYLIKDFLNEADSRLLEQQQCQPRVPPSPVPSACRYLSEIEEVEWSYDGARLVSSPAISREQSVEAEEQDRDELRRLRGKAKAQLIFTETEISVSHYLGKKGKAPLAFPTEEEHVPRLFTGASTTRCFSEGAEERFKDSGSMPAWFPDAYRSLAQLDEYETRSPELQHLQQQEGASSSVSLPESESVAIQQKQQNEEACSSSHGVGELIVQKAGALFGGDSHSEQDEASTLGDGVRKVIFGDGESEESKEVEEEGMEPGQQGPGWLWKLSLCASVSFVTWVLANGAKIQCRSLLPTIREREQPLKILRRKSSMVKVHEAQDSGKA